MRKTYNKLLLNLLLLVILGSMMIGDKTLVVGAPPYRVERAIQPETNLLYWLGSSTKAWSDIFTQNLSASGTITFLGLKSSSDCLVTNTSGVVSTTTCSAVSFSSAATSTAGLTVSTTTNTITYGLRNSLVDISGLATTTGNLIAASSSGGWGALTVGSDGQFLRASSTAIRGVAWESFTPAIATSTAGINFSSSGQTHTFSLRDVLVQISGLGTTKGNLMVGNSAGTAYTALGVGTSGYVLMASSSATNGVSWEVASGGITTLNGLTGATQTFATSTNSASIAISSSGTTHTFKIGANLDTINSRATTTGNVLVASSTGGWQALGIGTSGYVLTASSSAPNGASWEASSGGTTDIFRLSYIDIIVNETSRLATSTTGSGGFSISTLGGELSGGGNADNISRLEMATSTFAATSTPINWNNDQDLDMFVNFNSDWNTAETFIGMGLASVPKLLDTATTTAHVGFMFANNGSTIKASVANGTSQSSSTLSINTPSNFHHYGIDYNTGVNAKFYVDEVLVATITTNLPSGNNRYTPLKMIVTTIAGPGSFLDVGYLTQMRIRIYP